VARFDGADARISVSDCTVKLAAIMLLPTLTCEAPVKLLPKMVMGVPAGPLVGVKLVIWGGGAGGMTSKSVDDVDEPPGLVVTVNGPVLAPFCTLARICVSEESR
jgi:hypothetical protein